MEFIVAGITSAVVTVFDLDKVIYIPKSTENKRSLYAWLAAFVFINAVLAALLYEPCSSFLVSSGLPSWLQAVLVGLSYHVLVKAKLVTFTDQSGRPVPIGLESFYLKFKDFFFARIDRIVRDARRKEIGEEAKKGKDQLYKEIEKELLLTARFSAEEKKREMTFVVGILKDKTTDDDTKATILAIYLLSDQKVGPLR